MNSRLIPLGAVLALLGVACGAFGAHALRGILEPAMLQAYQTGVLYHLLHALGILLIGVILPQATRPRWVCWSGITMAGGILLFSGSLYLLAITGIRWLGVITPLGGTLFLAAWGLLALGTRQKTA